MDNTTDDTDNIAGEEARRDRIPWEGVADTLPLRNRGSVEVAAGLDRAVVADLAVVQKKDPVVVASIALWFVAWFVFAGIEMMTTRAMMILCC